MSDYPATEHFLEMSRTPDYKAVFRTLCLFEYYNLKIVDSEGNNAIRMIFETIFGIDYKKMEEESDMNRITYQQVLPAQF